jgi:hypothetical protein
MEPVLSEVEGLGMTDPNEIAAGSPGKTSR